MIPSAAVFGQDPGEYVPGDLIVTFAPAYMPAAESVSQNPLEQYVAESTYDVVRMFLLHFPDSCDILSIRDELAELPCFSRVSLNLFMGREYGAIRAEFPDTLTKFSAQWHYHDALNDDADLDAPEAWAVTKGSPEVVVAIHDSGTMLDIAAASDWELHSDLRYYWTSEDIITPEELEFGDINYQDSDDPDALADNVVGYNFAPHWPGEENEYEIAFWHSVPKDWKLAASDDFPLSSNCISMFTHGTNVASIALGLFGNGARGPAGGDIVGMANGCSAYIVRSTLTNFVARLADEIAAIVHAAEHADVINMSWGYTADQLPAELQSALDYAADVKDCVLVAITWNDGWDDRIRYPARYPKVLAVGAINKDLSLGTTNGLPTGQVYSNYNKNARDVDVVAPVGAGVPANDHTICLDPCPCAQDETYTTTIHGTSFAAPQVSGIAALIRSRFPGLRQDRVRSRIMRSAEYYWAPSDSFKFGKGKVNAYRAITEWGKITDNRVWKLYAAGDTKVESRDGVYYVSGDVVIEPGASLTIHPGTIRVAPVDPDIPNLGSDASRVEIIVKGTLNVLGTSSNPVVFESFTDSAPTESDWVGIRFEPGSKGILQHANIQHATQDVVVTRPSVSVSTWDAKKTLYLDSDLSVTSDMTIATDEDLYVLGTSDVIVTAGSGVDLTVNGSLICKGVGTKKPEFRSSSGAPRSWGILTLSAASSGHTLHSAIIRDAQLACRTHVPLTIDSCLIRSTVDGVQSYANVVVRNTTMHDFTGSAIVWLAGNLDLKNLDIYNSGYGLYQSTVTSTGTLVCRKVKLHDIDFRRNRRPVAKLRSHDQANHGSGCDRRDLPSISDVCDRR